MMKWLLVSITIILVTPVFLAAQPVPPPQPDVVPITGIEYLLLGGGAYGIYRFQKKRKKRQA